MDWITLTQIVDILIIFNPHCLLHPNLPAIGWYVSPIKTPCYDGNRHTNGRASKGHSVAPCCRDGLFRRDGHSGRCLGTIKENIRIYNYYLNANIKRDIWTQKTTHIHTEQVFDSKLVACDSTSFIWQIHSVRLANQSQRHCWQKQHQSRLLNKLQAQDIWEVTSICYWKAVWVRKNMNLSLLTINTQFSGFRRSITVSKSKWLWQWKKRGDKRVTVFGMVWQPMFTC